MEPVIPNPIPEGCCVFCDSPSQSVERYGKFLHHEESGIYAHYYCMLFACGLSQRGETNEGIEGFLIKDILAERKRAQKLKCKYCKKKGASVGCSVKACHQIYHYGCGVDEGAIYLFYDSFVSYCVKHRPVQKVLPSSCSPGKGTCPICMENVETSPGDSVLKTPCCKGTWLHRDCVQMQALSAGYFFRCAICNNENEFQDEMKKFGIYLPEKDADWEFGGNAYQELYERHNRCDVDKCRCPRGRKYATQSGQWEVVLCDLCGSAGCHLACGGLATTLDDWACRDCTSTFTRGFMDQNSSTNGGGKEKYIPSPGSQPTRTPGPGGTRVRSAIRSQGKRPRPPPTTPRPLKKTKHSSTPLCPPLSPVSSQQSSLSSSPKSTPCQTMKFPRVSLSPTYEREVSGPGSSRGSGVGKFGELLPKLDCYVALEPTSQKVYCPNLSMPSLSPAASAKKRKSGNKLKCKKARKLDLTSCHLINETKTTQIYSSKRQGNAIQTGNNNLSAPAVIGSQSGDGMESTIKPSWGSRLLDSVGSFLWRKSPSKHRASESSKGNQERKATCNSNDDIQKSQKQCTDIGNSSSSSLDSGEGSPPISNSPIALSEEIKAQIIPITSDSIPSKTKNMLHDLTSWKDDTTWKEAKQDLAHLFQVDGRATRSALKKDGKMPVETPEKQRKAIKIKRDDIPQKPTLQKEQPSDVQSKLSNSHDHTYSHRMPISPVALSEKVRAQIIPVTSDSIPTKTKNLLHDLTSWKDDTTWKEAKQDLAHLFQVDGRATRSALKKDVETPVKIPGYERKAITINRDDIPQQPILQRGEPSDLQSKLSNSHDYTYSHQVPFSPVTLSEEVRAQIIPVTSDSIPTKTKNLLHDLTSWKDDTTWKEAKQDLAHLFQVDGRATRSALKKDVETPVKIPGYERKAITINRDDIPQQPTLQRGEPSDLQSQLSNSHDYTYSHQVPFSPVTLSEEVRAQIIPVTSDSIPTKTKNLLHDLTSWKDDTTWKEAKQDLAHLFQVDGRATRSALKKEGATPAKGSEIERKANPSDSVVIAQKSPASLKSLLVGQSKLDSLDSSHQHSNYPIFVLAESHTQIVSLPTESRSSKGKSLLKDLTSWKDDTTWKEAKQDLAHLFQVDGRATRSALKKEGAMPAKGSEKERKANSNDSVVIAQKSPVLLKSLLVGQSKLDCLDSSLQHSNFPISVLEERDTQIVSLPTESRSSKGKHLLKDLTSWKDDTTWKEAKQDLAHLFQVDGRVTRRALQKDEVQMAKSTALCSPAKKKRKLECSLSHSTSSPALPSGKTVDRMRNLSTGQFFSQKKSTNKIDPEKVVQHTLPAPNGLLTKESSEIHDKQVNEIQDHHPHSFVEKAAVMAVLPTTGTIQRSALTPQNDDVTWKKPKGDLVKFSQVDGRTPRSVMCKDREPESSTLTKEDDTTFEIHGISILKPLKKIEQVNQKHDVAVETGCKDLQEAILQNEANTSLASIVQNTEPCKAKTDEGHLFPLESASNLPRGAKNWSLDVRQLTAWKGGETWKEFRGDMAVLLQVDGRTTRNKAKIDGLKGICGSPKVVGKETISSSIKKGQLLSSMPVLTKIVPDDEEICSPTQKMHLEENSPLPSNGTHIWAIKSTGGEPQKGLNANLEIDNPSCNALGLLSSNEIRLGTTCDASPYSVHDIRKESTIENRKSRKRLSRVFSVDHNAEVNEKHDKGSKKIYCDVNFEMPTSKIGLTLTDIDIEADKASNSLQEVAKPIMLDRSSQTAASIEEVDVYISSMGLWYKEPNYLPPPFKTHRNLRTGYTQTYNSKYEKHHTVSTPTIDQSVSNEENGFNGELKDMTELCDGDITSQKINCLPQKDEIAISSLQKDAKDMKQAAGERCTYSSKKGSRRRGNSCTSPSPHLAISPKTPSVKKPRHASEPPVLSPHESLAMRDDQRFCLPNAKKAELKDIITDAGYVSHCNQDEKVVCGKSSIKKVTPGAVQQPKCCNKTTRMTHQQSLIKIGICHGASGDLDQLLQTDENCRGLHHKEQSSEHVDYSDASRISTIPSHVTNACAQLFKEDIPARNESGRALSETAKICRSLVDETLGNAMKQSKCLVKKTQHELLQAWTKEDLWKEAKEDLQMLLNAEERITRSCRKKPKETKMAEGPSVAKEKTELGSSTPIAKPSPSLDLRKRKYCCSHMRSPWKASPAKNEAIANGISREPRDLQQYSPVFRKRPHRNTDGKLDNEEACAFSRKVSETLNSFPGRKGNTPASMRKIWKPRVHSSVECVQKEGRTNTSWYSSKKFGVPRLKTDETRKVEANKEFQKCTAKKMGRPRKQILVISEPENSGTSREPQVHESEMKKKLGRPRKYPVDVTKQEESGSPSQQVVCTSEKKKLGRPRKHPDDVTQQEKSESLPKQVVCTSEKKTIGRPRKHPDDVTQQEKSESPLKQVVCTSEKKTIGRPRKHPDDVTQQEKSESLPKQVVCTSEKKTIGRPRKHPDDVTQQEKSESPLKQVVCTSEKKTIGRPRKHPDDVTQQEKSESPLKQVVCTSEKKTIGRPRKLPVDVTQQEKSESPLKQEVCTSEKKTIGRPRKLPVDVTQQEKSESPLKQVVCTSEKKTIGRPRKHPDDVTQQEKSESPLKQEVCTSEKKTIGRPRKLPVDVTQQEKSGSPPKQVLCTSEKKKIGRPRKYPVDVTQQEMSGSPSKQVLCTSEKKKIGRPRQHSINILAQKSDCGNASKSPNNGKVSVVSDVQQSCQGTVANSRRIRKARRRLESSTIHPTTGKAIVDNDLAVCFMDLQEVLQAGQIETRNFSTQTDATVQEVEAYVTSRGKHYMEPCYIIPRPNLNRMEATFDMRTQTYNLKLSQCLEDEINRSYPPLVYDEANGPPSTLKKTKSKAKQLPPTPEKMSSAYISPCVSAASSPVTISAPCSARTDSSSQTETSVEEVEAYIQSMGEWYREPSIIVTGLQEARGEVKNSVRTQTYNLNLPDRELPMFKKKWSKRVHNQMKSTQTEATWEEVNAYIEQNKQLYTDPKYSTTQSYSLIGSSLTRHIPTQTYSFGLDEETSEAFSKKGQEMLSKDTERKGIPESDQTPATEKAHDFFIEPRVDPVEKNDTEERQEIDRPSHQQGKSDQSLNKPFTTDCKVTGTGISNVIKTDSITSGHRSKKQNWFRIKPKK